MSNIAIVSTDTGESKRLKDELVRIYGNEHVIQFFENVKALLEQVRSFKPGLIISSFFDAEMNAIVNFAPEFHNLGYGTKIIVFHDRSDARFDIKCVQSAQYGVHKACFEKKDFAQIVQTAVEKISGSQNTEIKKRPPSP